MANFDFLKGNSAFGTLYGYCKAAEECAQSDPDNSAINARKALEYLVKAVYLLNHYEASDSATLFELVDGEQFRGFLGADSYDLLKRLHYIRKAGNAAAHMGNVTRREAFFCLVNLHAFTVAVLKKLGLINDAPAAEKTAAPPPPSAALTEYDTRRLFIDMMLKEAGWDVLETEGAILPSKACIEIELAGMPNSTGTGYADYVLFGANGKPLAVIEAKRTSKNPAVGRHQAELYADCLEAKYGIRPVIYYSNGYKTFILDGIYPPREVYGYHTEEELALLIQKRRRGDIADLRISDDISGREYQKRAIKAVCEHLSAKHRKALLVMATGTGKTRTAISLVDVLTRNSWVKNVLFLADRTALVSQAHKNFAKLLPQMSYCVLSDNASADRDMGARITLSTYQTMINYIDADDKRFSVGRFDLIIIDEAHRSVFGKYGSIFAYFDAFLVGLTATPREEVARSTYQLFDLDEGVPNFAYELQEAVDDGYLTPFQAFNKGTGILREGIRYDELSEAEKEQMEQVWEYESAALSGEDPHRDIGSNEIFKYIFNEDTVDKVLQDLMGSGLKVQDGERIGKTIIFAANHQHAELIVRRFGVLYPEFGSDFCQLIDNYVNYAKSLIEQFEVRDKLPQIAVSVDMLDVGIDVPDVLNLVFFKVVKSKIKFWQMIGRGTRLSENIFGEGKHKTCFHIYDWCGNFDYFSLRPNGVDTPPAQSLSQRLFCLRADIACELQKAQYQADEFSKNLHDELKAQLHADVAALNDSRIGVRQNWEIVSRLRSAEAWQYISAVDVVEIKDRIAPLLTGALGDESAKRFDTLLLLIELSLLDDTVKSAKAQRRTIAIAQALQDRASHYLVQKHMDTINEVLTPAFWENLNLRDLERVRIELREILWIIEKEGRKTFVTDIDDVVVDGGAIDAPITPMTYRQRVFDYLAKNRNLPVLQKITHIRQLTAEDIAELERILWSELGSKNEYERYVARMLCGDNVGVFIRSIIGIDRAEAERLFSELISSTVVLNSQQEEYLKTIITYVCANGDIDADTLINRHPFSEYDWLTAFGPHASALGTYIQKLHTAVYAA